MATWRDRMKQRATFRGVPFFIDSTDASGGHRLVKHEYPGKDVPFGEPMGLKARSFSVEAYVIGDNYLDQKAALITALEKPGPGELIHPGYFGTRRVIPENYRVRESKDEGGWATISIEFFETPAQPVQPADVSNGPALVTASVEKALKSVKLDFLSKYSPNSFVDKLSDQLRVVTLSINNAISQVHQETQTAASLRSRIDDFEDSIESLVSLPEDLAASLGSIFGDIGSGSALLEIYDYDPGVPPPETTDRREQEAANFDALQRFVQRTVLINAALLAPSETYDSYDAALAARNALTDLIDEQAETISDDAFPDLMELRASLVKAVPGDDSELGRLLSYTPQFTIPSLVLAHRLYGNLDFESDLLARNGISRPGMIPGGQALEILSDG